MESNVTEERHIDAVLHYDTGGKGRVDSFILSPDVNSRVFQEWSDTRAYFAQVFGPIPEPGTLWLLLAAMLGTWMLHMTSSNRDDNLMAARRFWGRRP